jgi:hypothetical protein
MGLESIWQQVAIAIYQFWGWFEYETGDHPFLAMGIVVVIIFAYTLYKIEVRSR